MLDSVWKSAYVKLSAIRVTLSAFDNMVNENGFFAQVVLRKAEPI